MIESTASASCVGRHRATTEGREGGDPPEPMDTRRRKRPGRKRSGEHREARSEAEPSVVKGRRYFFGLPGAFGYFTYGISPGRIPARGDVKNCVRRLRDRFASLLFGATG